MDYLWVGVGGGLGAAGRYGAGRLLGPRLGDGFPAVTLLVNVSGCFAIGLLLTLLAARGADPAWRLLLVVGVLGGYTTFSAFGFETVSLAQRGQWERAALYVLGSNLGGLAACAAGVALARAIGR